MAGPRQAQPIPLQFLPGLYTNETDHGASGRWIRGNNVRWKDGLPEKLGGYELYDLVDPEGELVNYMGKVRSVWEWDSLDSETWIAFGTSCKLYLINRGVLYDITPMRRQVTLIDAITTQVVDDPAADDHYGAIGVWIQAEGPDLSTTFLDSGPYGTVITPFNAASITATNPESGIGALDCDGNKYLSVPKTLGGPMDVGVGDFTIEMWVRFDAIGGTQEFMDTGGFGNGNGIRLYLSGPNITCQCSFFHGWFDLFAPALIIANVWNHVAVCKQGNNGYLALNGVVIPQIGGMTGSFSFGPAMHFGGTGYPFSFSGPIGAMDEIKVTKGFALYTGAYTPPTVPQRGVLTAPVVDVGHGAQDGDHIRISGASTVGGIDINGEHNILQVIDLDNYIIELSDAPLSSATGGGTFSIQYDISCGLESAGPLYGYGVGPYGEETYGTARSSSTFIGQSRVWSLDNWGEDLLASPNGETLYVWRRTTGPDSRAVAVVGAPENIERMMVGPDDRHVIAFGTNLASTNQHDKMFVRWSKGDDYATWLASASNDAGSKRLDMGSRLITAVKTNNGILAFTDRALYFVSLVGGTDVYQITSRGATVEIISPEAVVDVDGVPFFMARNDFYYFDGTLNILPCDIRTQIFGTKTQPGINQAMAGKVHVRLVKEFNEIWWSFPEFGETENSAAAIYNYKLKCWYYSNIPREAGNDASPAYDRLPYAFYNNRFWMHEIGNDGDDGDGYVEALPAFIESNQNDVMEGGVEIRMSRLIPDFDNLDGGPVEISILGKERPQAAVTVTDGPRLIFSDTEEVHPDLRIRQIAIRIESKDDLGVAWRMGSWSAYVVPTTRKSK